MSDIDQGQQGDHELFREALDAPTLKDFENPKFEQMTPAAPPEKPAEDKTQPRGEDGRFQKNEPPPQEDQEGRIPPHRLREESEARRRAEQELSELRAKVAAYEVNRQQPQQPQQPQKPPDIFDNPSAFVEQTMLPYLQQMEARHRFDLEQQSARNAQQHYGVEAVDQAYNGLLLALRNGDASALGAYQNAMGSYDPFGIITKWHVDRQTLNTIGGDLDAYKQSVLENAMKDPNFQQRFLQSMRGQSLPQVNRPVTMQQIAAANRTVNQPSSSVYPPSVADIGAAGPDELIQEASDDALYRAAVTAKRRPTLPGR